MFMDQQSDDATTSTKPMTDSTNDNLVDDIMGQFDVDFDTLCVHVAERKQEELKAKESIHITNRRSKWRTLLLLHLVMCAAYSVTRSKLLVVPLTK
jgi:hypothetical protein